MDLLPRLQNDTDRKLVSDLHDKLCHVEDDANYDSVLLSGYRQKFGPLGFSEAVRIVDEARMDASKTSEGK